jgi:signal transduction histidine kinase
MEERVKRLGGTLTVDSAPGRGTAIKADLPLPASAGNPV